MGLSDFFSSGGSKQEQNSGFQMNDKNAASKYAANRAMDLGNMAYGDLQSAVPHFTMSSSIPGLFKEQEGAANVFANKMFANASAGGALRGQYSMNNTPGVVGSAITNMGSTLLPLISNNLQQSMLLPEQIKAQRYQNAMTPLQALVSGLGSSGSAQQSGPGLGYQFGNAFMQSFGGGLGSSLASGASAGMGGGGLEGMASAMKG